MAAPSGKKDVHDEEGSLMPAVDYTVSYKGYSWENLLSDLRNRSSWGIVQEIRATLRQELKLRSGLVVAGGDFELHVEVVDKKKKSAVEKKQGYPIPCRLLNRSLNCFFNSALQCFAVTEELVSHLMGDTFGPCGDEFCLACALRSHLSEARKGEAFYPSVIVKQLEHLGGDFGKRPSGEHDAGEFASQVLSRMREQDNHGCNEIINFIFRCSIDAKNKCEKCGHESSAPMVMYSLQLPIPIDVPIPTLEDCFRLFLEQEKLPEDTRCDSCKEVGEINRKTSISVAPKILYVTLLRFQQNGQKIENFVEYPMELNLNPFMSTSNGHMLYELYGVIVHSGHSGSGHYKAYVKTSQGSWFCCDDNWVTRLEGSIADLGAYILFYRRVDEHEQQQKQQQQHQQQHENGDHDAFEEDFEDSMDGRGVDHFDDDAEDCGHGVLENCDYVGDHNPVILSCQNLSHESLKKLLDNKAQVDLDTGGPLCMAIALKQLHEKDGKAIRDLLIDGGASPSQKDGEGQSSLHVAAMLNDKESLRILVEKEGDVNIRNAQNRTPLHVALKYGAGECVKYLLEQGADYSLRDNDGDTPFHIAIRGAHKNLDLLSTMLGHDSTPIHNVKNYRCETLGDLLKRVPRKWIYEELEVKLKDKGVDVQLNDLLEEEQIESLQLVEVDNLEDAKLAGVRLRREECTLIITEGKSASNFAKEAIKLLGKDKYGLYSLKGKLTSLQTGPRFMPKCKQIINIFIALGLIHSTFENYVFDIKKLRYAHVLLMIDQDADGDHIRGLLMNMFYRLAPQLLQRPFFLQDFVTCLYKATHKTKKTLTFHRLEEFHRLSVVESPSEWTISYFKGLQSFSVQDVEKYCENFEDNVRYFVWSGDGDSNSIEKAFSNDCPDDRKRWICNYKQGVHEGLYSTIANLRSRTVGYAEFIQKELVSYFVDSTKRCIPNLMDGLNITPRKVMCYFLEKCEGRDYVVRKIKDLASEVSQHCVYHHRDKSLQRSIFLMAKNYCGTNNVNLLVPHGNFGSREDGGVRIKDFDYLEVELSPIAYNAFPEVDFQFLTRLTERGKAVQPEWYAPIFPLVLVNGVNGIGSGFASRVLTYNFLDVTANIKRLLEGLPPQEMLPSSRGFQGSVEQVPVNTRRNSYIISGKWQLDDDTKTILTITEIPFTIWYSNYEKNLNKRQNQGIIKKYEVENVGANGRRYKVVLSEALDDANAEEKLKKLQLKVTAHSNMLLYNAQGCLQHYSSPIRVLHEFYEERLKIYEKRKEANGLSESATELWLQELLHLEQQYRDHIL